MPAILTAAPSPLGGAALDYAERGWKVLPLQGKRPAGALAPHGLSNASDDLDTIRSWWRLEPAANVGLACRGSGFVALDVDPRNGGDDTLSDLERTLGGLPDTVSSETGGGGSHLLFLPPERRLKSRDGIDVQDRAYIVAPPSVHPETRRPYAWDLAPDEVELAALPDPWALAFSPKRDTRYRTANTYPKGARNVTLTKVAGAMRRAGLDEDGIAAALLIENRRKCSPPLPDDEVRRIARSIGSRSTGPPWALDPLGYAHGFGNLPPTARLVLVALARRAHDSGYVRGGAWVADDVGVGRQTVSRAVGELERAGAITVQRFRGQRGASLYRLELPY